MRHALGCKGCFEGVRHECKGPGTIIGTCLRCLKKGATVSEEDCFDPTEDEYGVSGDDA
jgi:hypothetical protein